MHMMMIMMLHVHTANGGPTPCEGDFACSHMTVMIGVGLWRGILGEYSTTYYKGGLDPAVQHRLVGQNPGFQIAPLHKAGGARTS